MKKLLNLKQWLTLAETARHLSGLTGEDVTEADVLRLALDGHLALSIYFANPASGKTGKFVSFEHLQKREVRSNSGEPISYYYGVRLEGGRFFAYQNPVIPLEGVWDLPLNAADRIWAEQKYQSLTGGPTVKLVEGDGAFVIHPDGTSAHIIERTVHAPPQNEGELGTWLYRGGGFFPAQALPDDAVFVVRTAALKRLEATLAESDAAMDRPIGQRERTTLLVIIAALAKLARIDVSKPSSAASAIESQTAEMGVRIAARTIENHLNRIAEALDSRTDD